MAMFGLNDAIPAPALRAYARTSIAIAASQIRLTTNERLIRAGDDVASSSAAARLRTQDTTLRSSLVNGAKATSFLQVASNGLSQITDILTALSQLTATANQSGITTRQYMTLNAQFQTQKALIDSIVAATTYNGASILNGSASGSGAPVYQLGDVRTGAIVLSIPDVSSTTLLGSTVSLKNAGSAAAATGTVSTAQDSIDTAIATVEAYQVRLDTAAAAVKDTIHGVDTAITSLLGTNDGAEQQSITLNTLQQQRTAAIIAQTRNLTNSLLSLAH